jgi:hypothetical protein
MAREFCPICEQTVEVETIENRQQGTLKYCPNGHSLQWEVVAIFNIKNKITNFIPAAKQSLGALWDQAKYQTGYNDFCNKQPRSNLTDKPYNRGYDDAKSQV